jgi:hypothetical protein
MQFSALVLALAFGSSSAFLPASVQRAALTSQVHSAASLHAARFPLFLV